MSDQRIREQERQATTGTLQDQATYLRALMRAGRLPAEHLELLAFLSHAAARQVVPPEAGPFSLSNTQRCGHDPGLLQDRRPFPCVNNAECFGEWAKKLGHWGVGPATRAGLISARAVLSAWPLDLNDIPLREETRNLAFELLDRVEAWVCCPCEAHADAANPWLSRTPMRERPGQLEGTGVRDRRGARFRAVALTGIGVPRVILGVADTAFHNGKSGYWVNTIGFAATIGTNEWVVAQIQAGLTAWILEGAQA